ncbi:hypothetical protein GE21DRAFT_1279174 [Neurospora crassa]|nr:hypothetical protein GE21DRAFT_1279174 [Neurospora crassa]
MVIGEGRSDERWKRISSWKHHRRRANSKKGRIHKAETGWRRERYEIRGFCGFQVAAPAKGRWYRCCLAHVDLQCETGEDEDVRDLDLSNFPEKSFPCLAIVWDVEERKPDRSMSVLNFQVHAGADWFPEVRRLRGIALQLAPVVDGLSRFQP